MKIRYILRYNNLLLVDTSSNIYKQYNYPITCDKLNDTQDIVCRVKIDTQQI